MKIIKSKRKKIIVIGIILIYIFANRINNSLGNPVLWDIYESASAEPYSITNNNCSLIDANIMYKIYWSDMYHYNLNIEANYTIYNPDSEFNNTILAPFPDDGIGDLDIFVYTVDPYKAIDFEFVWHWKYLYYDEYLIIRPSIILVSNITLPDNNTFKLNYYMNYYNLFIYGYNTDVLYDLYTADSWNGILFERIEFQVYGRNPDSFSENNNIEIINHTNYMSYIWTWDNQAIDVDSVYVRFSLPKPADETIGVDNLIQYILIIQTGIFSIATKIAINKKKKGVKICTN